MASPRPKRPGFRTHQAAALVSLVVSAAGAHAAAIGPAKPGPILDTHIHLVKVATDKQFIFKPSATK